jgi:hypothetical protein
MDLPWSYARRLFVVPGGLRRCVGAVAFLTGCPPSGFARLLRRGETSAGNTGLVSLGGGTGGRCISMQRSHIRRITVAAKLRATSTASRTFTKLDCSMGASFSAALYLAIQASSAFSTCARSVAMSHPTACVFVPMPYTPSQGAEQRSEGTTLLVDRKDDRSLTLNDCAPVTMARPLCNDL